MPSNPAETVRLRPIIAAYLRDLAAIGPYGKGKAGVMRRFIENGIAQAIERGLIEKRSAADFGELPEDDDDS
jgi:hypothetical protein